MELLRNADDVAMPNSRGGRGRAIVPLLISMALMLVCSACASSPSAATPSSVPSGWVTHDFGKAAVAIPPSWQVKHDTACTVSSSPGVLVLGEPNPPSETCNEAHSPGNKVFLVADLDPHGYSGNGQSELVNGITVYLDASGKWNRWVIPSLGVVLAGTGPDADAVLHTIHRS
jgi:hypothetical protein